MKKDWQGLVIVILSLVLLIMAGYVGYIVYERNGGTLASESTHKKVQESKREELDIHSRLVTSLYNKVRSRQTSCFSTWIFGTNEFDVNTASEEDKMTLVANNLSAAAKIRIDCSDPRYSGIPTTIGSEMSVCELNNKYSSQLEEFGYKKEYVETVYKDLFGSSHTLDTSAGIPLRYLLGTLHYTKSFDMYVFYSIITGVTCAETDSFELVSAEKIGSDIKLYEKYMHVADENAKKEELKFVYTFKLEDDGMYSFVSRKKVS